ncbi:MAG: DUF2497 domain-containing protein [Alphaproteobacteria bacterium]|nr:DUF2497 domain-containing protein [Alphaproteobacteria bacterium]
MSDNPSEAEEPSIEEILASIRQIISDDDEEGGEQEVAAEPEPVEEEIIEEPEEDVLDLTDEVEPVEEEVDLDFVDVEEEIEEEVYEPEPDFEPTPSSILSENAQAATMSSLSKLVGGMPLNRRGYDGVTLEDIVRELLNPMLRDWMDTNLPPMVERIVQKELEKLARRALDE